MVDTRRFQLGPALIMAVGGVAAQLARRQDGVASPLQVATYLPMDADSVCRGLESLEEDFAMRRVQRGEICLFQFDDPDEVPFEVPDLDAAEAWADFWRDDELASNLANLKSEEGWLRKVHEQHEVLGIAGRADERRLELTYFLNRTDISRAKVRSILNDFVAEGYIEDIFDEESETLEYTFPVLRYPEQRQTRNMQTVDSFDETARAHRIWLVLGVFVLVLLGIIIGIRFYAGG